MRFRILTVAAVILAAFFTHACTRTVESGEQAQPLDRLIILTKTAEHTFTVEFADTDEARRLGLMFRTELSDDAGMLFDFGDPRPVSMWMKNTLLSLDMAFIDEKGVIRRIASNTTPRSLESIASGVPVVAVLEVNGGTLERLGIKAGDRVQHRLFESH